jgi:hypothetical protein
LLTITDNKGNCPIDRIIVKGYGSFPLAKDGSIDLVAELRQRQWQHIDQASNTQARNPKLPLVVEVLLKPTTNTVAELVSIKTPLLKQPLHINLQAPINKYRLVTTFMGPTIVDETGVALSGVSVWAVGQNETQQTTAEQGLISASFLLERDSTQATLVVYKSGYDFETIELAVSRLSHEDALVLSDKRVSLRSLYMKKEYAQARFSLSLDSVADAQAIPESIKENSENIPFSKEANMFKLCLIPVSLVLLFMLLNFRRESRQTKKDKDKHLADSQFMDAVANYVSGCRRIISHALSLQNDLALEKISRQILSETLNKIRALTITIDNLQDELRKINLPIQPLPLADKSRQVSYLEKKIDLKKAELANIVGALDHVCKKAEELMEHAGAPINIQSFLPEIMSDLKA